MESIKPLPRPLVFVREAVHDLEAYLTLWVNRREPSVVARAAAEQAVERIDDATRHLAELRGQLVAEIEASDRAWLKLDDDSPHDPRD